MIEESHWWRDHPLYSENITKVGASGLQPIASLGPLQRYALQRSESTLEIDPVGPDGNHKP